MLSIHIFVPFSVILSNSRIQGRISICKSCKLMDGKARAVFCLKEFWNFLRRVRNNFSSKENAW